MRILGPVRWGLDCSHLTVSVDLIPLLLLLMMMLKLIDVALSGGSVTHHYFRRLERDGLLIAGGGGGWQWKSLMLLIWGFPVLLQPALPPSWALYTASTDYPPWLVGILVI